MADTSMPTTTLRAFWNKGRLIGQKPPLKLREVWTVRTRLQMAGDARELALFNLAIDSKLRGCDLVRLMARDMAHGSQVLARATVAPQKTRQPVRFEVTDQIREARTAWIAKAKLAAMDYLFPSRQRGSPHVSTRQRVLLLPADRGVLLDVDGRADLERYDQGHQGADPVGWRRGYRVAPDPG